MKHMRPHIIIPVKSRINIIRDHKIFVIQQRIGQFQGMMPKRTPGANTPGVDI